MAAARQRSQIRRIGASLKPALPLARRLAGLHEATGETSPLRDLGYGRLRISGPNVSDSPAPAVQPAHAADGPDRRGAPNSNRKRIGMTDHKIGTRAEWKAAR